MKPKYLLFSLIILVMGSLIIGCNNNNDNDSNSDNNIADETVVKSDSLPYDRLVLSTDGLVLYLPFEEIEKEKYIVKSFSTRAGIDSTPDKSPNPIDTSKEVEGIIGKFITTHKSIALTRGVVGNAFAFDGVSSYVGVPYLEKLASPTFSVAVWVKPKSLPSSSKFIAKLEGGGSQWAIEYHKKDGKLIAPYFDYQDDELPVDEWSFVVLTYDGATFKTYLNADLTHESQGTFTVPKVVQEGEARSSFTNLKIGMEGGCGACNFQGDMDEFMMFNHDLTLQEISTFYETGLSLIS